MPGIGIPPLEANLPPILKRNYGKWISHEHPRPGVIKHDSETGEACYTVRAGMPPNARVSTQTLRLICDVADEFAEGYFRVTQRNSCEFVGVPESAIERIHSAAGANGLSGRRHQPFAAQHGLLHRLFALPPGGDRSGGHHEGRFGNAAEGISKRLPAGQTENLRLRLPQQLRRRFAAPTSESWAFIAICRRSRKTSSRAANCRWSSRSAPWARSGPKGRA